MARTPKHPGLQQKFEHALTVILEGAGALKARDLLEEINSHKAEFGISDEELADLGQNFANYAARAKDIGVIVSGGPWGGYQLAALASDLGASQGESSAAPQPAFVKSPGPTELAPAPRQHWESFLHLPLTVALSAHFSSRVLSLENATDNVRWGNPDMLMLRPSPLSRVQEFNASLEPKTFQLVDTSPECILSSIEIKASLERDRAKLFTAIAEAAANSRWANEAWLVFVDRNPSDQPLDDDVISLARSVEIGILEVRLSSGNRLLKTHIHLAAPTRSTLRIGELTKERVGVLQEAQTLLKAWFQDETTFLDVASAEQKGRLLIQQALENLRRQKGFTATGELKNLLTPLTTSDGDRTYVELLLRAAMRAGAFAASIDFDDNLSARLADAADNALIKKLADAFRADVLAFGEVFLTDKK